MLRGKAAFDGGECSPDDATASPMRYQFSAGCDDHFHFGILCGIDATADGTASGGLDQRHRYGDDRGNHPVFRCGIFHPELELPLGLINKGRSYERPFSSGFFIVFMLC